MTPIPDELRRLAASQHGIVTRVQCIRAGLAPATVSRIGRPGGHGQRVLPGVLAFTTGPLTRRQLLVAALLHTGHDAQITGATSLELRGFRYAPNDQRVHVLVPAECQVGSRAFVVVHRTWHLPQPHLVDGLPTTPVARAAVDASRSLSSLREVVVLLSEAVQRRACTVEMLREEVERGEVAGSGLPRRALVALGAGTVSGPEYDLVRLVQRSGLVPPPEVNAAVVLGALRLFADLCWREARLIVEVDSVEHHGFGEDAEWTARRRAALVAAGWTVLSISPRRIREDPDGVLRDIEAAYLRGLERSAG